MLQACWPQSVVGIMVKKRYQTMGCITQSPVIMLDKPSGSPIKPGKRINVSAPTTPFSSNVQRWASTSSEETHFPRDIMQTSKGRIYISEVTNPVSWRSTILELFTPTLIWHISFYQLAACCFLLLNEVCFVRFGVNTYRLVDPQEQG